jgi:hypothetical protein
VSALSYTGETLASAAVTCTNAAALAVGSAVNTITWNPEIGAYAYNVYGRTAGAELLLKTVTWDSLHGIDANGNPGGMRARTPFGWDDNGTLTPAGSVPTKNGTGGALVEGPMALPDNSFANPLKLGSAYVWMTTTGKIFVKATAPTSDLDGAEPGGGGTVATLAQIFAGIDNLAILTSSGLSHGLIGVRAAQTLMGGGVHSYIGGAVKWSIAMNESGDAKGTDAPNAASNINIAMPSSGTVPIQGSASVATINANGIPLGTSQSLFFNPVTSSFVIVDPNSGTANFVAPSSWIWVCSQTWNPSAYVRFATGMLLTPGQSGSYTGGLPVKVVSSTVATLIAAATAGMGAMAFVTDATATKAAGNGTAVVGGGTNKVPVYCDGTSWLIG